MEFFYCVVPAQVLYGFKRQCAGAARVPRSHARPTRPLRRLAGPFHQEAMWPNCVARVHAGPRRSGREGLCYIARPKTAAAVNGNWQAKSEILLAEMSQKLHEHK